jgi:hypothetical protein
VTTVQWEWEGKRERLEQDMKPQELMARVMEYLEHINASKYGRSTDRSRYKRQS